MTLLISYKGNYVIIVYAITVKVKDLKVIVHSCSDKDGFDLSPIAVSANSEWLLANLVFVYYLQG